MKTAIFFLVFSMQTYGFVFNSQEKHLYNQRHFIDLQQELVRKGNLSGLSWVQKQQSDLRACKLLSQGSGNSTTIIKCMRFFKREHDLKLENKNSVAIKRELDLFCRHYSSRTEFIEQAITEEVLLKPHKYWQKCRGALWRQIYLTAYAKFQSAPIQTVSLLRRAEKNVSSDNQWALKAQRLKNQLQKTHF